MEVETRMNSRQKKPSKTAVKVSMLLEPKMIALLDKEAKLDGLSRGPWARKVVINYLLRRKP